MHKIKRTPKARHRFFLGISFLFLGKSVIMMFLGSYEERLPGPQAIVLSRD
jgi:hypothetical protein